MLLKEFLAHATMISDVINCTNIKDASGNLHCVVNIYICKTPKILKRIYNNAILK